MKLAFLRKFSTWAAPGMGPLVLLVLASLGITPFLSYTLFFLRVLFSSMIMDKIIETQ